MKKKKGIIISGIIVGIVAIGVLMYVKLDPFSRRIYSGSDFGIDNYVSKTDKDGDGIDDQTDVFKSVKEYIATNPKYESKYYASGYPDDGYGVCADVVGIGLLHAGYNLMELVNADILEHKDMYNIEKVDKKIDFRRSRNLNIYFKNNAISLTTDVYDIKEWQPGDIVVFSSHVGIISDKRNKKGVPYMIHHSGPKQKNYEENVLEKYTDIVGHYRIS